VALQWPASSFLDSLVRRFVDAQPTENPPPRPSKSGLSVRLNVVLILAPLPSPGKVCSAAQRVAEDADAATQTNYPAYVSYK